MPENDGDYSTRWQRIKTKFTKAWLRSGGENFEQTESQKQKGERGVWQRRFFEHTCQDENDLKRCVDYVHVNPLKHGLVERVVDWPWSSFHRYVQRREYPRQWGSANEWYGDEFRHFE